MFLQSEQCFYNETSCLRVTKFLMSKDVSQCDLSETWTTASFRVPFRIWGRGGGCATKGSQIGGAQRGNSSLGRQ